MIHNPMMSPWPGRIALAILAAVLAAPLSATAEPLTYTLVPGKCRFVALVTKAGLGAGLAHDHVVVARTLSGAVTLDPGDPTRTAMDITVDARTLEADPPALRKLYGLEGELSDEDRSKVTSNMRGPDQLSTGRHAQIRFRSTRVSAAKQAGHYKVTGQLTLRGVTREVVLVVKARIVEGVLKGSGRLSILQSDFGIEPYSAGLGLIKVSDRVTLDLTLEARPASPKAGPV